MKTSINKNESDFDKMKRESLEWLERYGKTAPPFISVAINAFSQLPAVTDSDIEREFERTHPARDEYEKIIAVNLAKAVRDGLIPASDNTVKEEENKVKFLINDVCKWEDSPGYDSLEKTLSDKYFVRFKNSISSAPAIKQGKEESAESILKAYLDNNEAQDAEVTGDGIYLSEPDVLILMKRFKDE